MGVEETSNSNPEKSLLTISNVASIEKKLDAIEARLKDKWMLPVSITVITAILTFGNYFVQRLYNKKDITENEMAKTYAQASAKSSADFYQLCYGKLDTVNKNFDSFCNLSPSEYEDSIITDQLIVLTSTIGKQFPLDPKVKFFLQEYTNFVAEQLADFETHKNSAIDLKKAYKESRLKYDKAITEINAAFLNPFR